MSGEEKKLAKRALAQLEQLKNECLVQRAEYERLLKEQLRGLEELALQGECLVMAAFVLGENVEREGRIPIKIMALGQARGEHFRKANITLLNVFARHLQAQGLLPDGDGEAEGE